MSPLIQTTKTIRVHCENCGHYRTRHVKGFGCLVCQFLISKGMRSRLEQCKESFTFRIGPREVEQARAHPKDSYDGQTTCATCGEIWWSHEGLLCPNGETLFVPAIGGDLV